MVITVRFVTKAATVLLMATVTKAAAVATACLGNDTQKVAPAMNNLTALWNDPSLGFMRLALLMILVAAPAFGLVGSFVVARRISYVAGSIAHAVLGGIGMSLYLQRVHGWEWLHPIFGALIVAVLSAVLIGQVQLRSKERDDSVIGAIWAIGMSVGLIFLSITPGYTDPMSYLFGNILVVSRFEIGLVLTLDIFLLAIVLLGYRRLQAVCFDEEFARLRNINTGWWYTLLLCMVGVSVVLLVSVVGIVLVIALLTLPAALAGRFTRSLAGMMALATAITLAGGFAGIAVSYRIDFPPGATIILLIALFYAISCLPKLVQAIREAFAGSRA